MEFPSSFFEAEVRDGFYVSSLMKRAWSAQLEVLGEVDKVCRKYNIEYFADYGTLLGAVRHGGFIPWDDDLDIGMKRQDYMKFLGIAHKELPGSYRLLNYYNNPEYDTFNTRVVNNDFVCVEDDFKQKYHGFAFISGIDIFVLDYVCLDQEEDEKRRKLFNSLFDIAGSIDPQETDPGEWKDLLNKIGKICGFEFDYNHPLRQQLFLAMDRIMSETKEEESELISIISQWYAKRKAAYPKKLYELSYNMKFEVTTVPVMMGYDEILKCKYKNYMELRRSGGAHMYPFYKKQESVIKEKFGLNLYPSFVADYDHIKQSEDERKIKKSQDKEKPDKKEIVFLPYKASQWNAIEPLWEKLLADHNNAVYVIPIPYFDVDNNMQLGMLHYEADQFPEYVDLTVFDQYDFAERHPDTIVIQNPYDEYDVSTRVPDFFYSDKLRKLTDNLVYVPPFETDEFNEHDERMKIMMDFYVTTPGVINADKVIVRSENIKLRYIEKLTDRFGIQSKGIWESKIVSENPFDRRNSVCEGIDANEVPDEWWPFLSDQDGNDKKVILYVPNLSVLYISRQKYIEKINRVMEVFKEHSDKVTVLWYVNREELNVIKNNLPELWEDYCKIAEAFKKSATGIYYEADDPWKAIAISDAYYGGRGSILRQFAALKRPTMLENIDI